MSVPIHPAVFYWIFSLFLTVSRGSFNLYKSSHPTRKTTDLFERLAYHEIITFSHNQFHSIDGTRAPIYPMNGRLSFDAFGRHYSLLIRKNVELFSDSYHTQIHRYNESTQQMEKSIHSTAIPQCYYTAEVESDPSETGHALFSACQGRGIHGWIHAFGEKIVIRPKLHLMDASYKGPHWIKHDHIAYRDGDLDRSDYPHYNGGHVCGHGHPLTEAALDKTIERWKDADHSKIEWILHQRNQTHHSDREKEEKSERHTHTQHTHEWRRRRLQSSKTRYVELAIVNDPGMMEENSNNYDFIEAKTISIVATLQNLYFNADMSSTVGTIQIVLSAIFYVESWDKLSEPALFCAGSGTAPSLYENSISHGSSYCEVEYSDYLSSFQSYRAVHLRDYDNAQLFSYYDFKDTVIGYASLPGMCVSSSSGGIEQCTYDDEYNANIVAHEMGHNFNMQHDGNGNSCPIDAYIMASVGNPGVPPPDTFSTCSTSYTNSFFSSSNYEKTLRCLDDKPMTTRYGVCRNGFVEEGESCDCGAAKCDSQGDPCCDGSTCALYASYSCSNDAVCCQECQIVDAGTVCRELDEENTCDIAQELCDGESSECPADLKYVEGTICLSDPGAGELSSFGYCYAGSCKSLDTQCQLYGAKAGTSYAVAPTQCSGFPLDWQVEDTKCDSSLRCERTTDDACIRLQGEKPDEGIPCNQSDNIASQCVEGVCQYSSHIFTYKWTTKPWQQCNISCRAEENSDEVGYQTRIVECTFQNGSAVDPAHEISLCNPENDETLTRPIDGRICNDFVCEFCAIQPNGKTVCGDHGECKKDLKICDCDSGWSGDRCDESPSLNFSGIVSSIYKTSNRTIKMRINPCETGDIVSEYDEVTATETIAVANITPLTDLLVGSTVGVRWKSSGDIALLAGEIVTDHYEFPLYVGTSLAHNDSTCDVENPTAYDPCFVALECNDFSFTIASDLVPSSYKLLIRFNNEFAIELPVLNIQCNEHNCVLWDTLRVVMTVVFVMMAGAVIRVPSRYAQIGHFIISVSFAGRVMNMRAMSKNWRFYEIQNVTNFSDFDGNKEEFLMQHNNIRRGDPTGDSTETTFGIYIVPSHVDCVAPTICFELERIDYKSSSEKCGGDNVANECVQC